MQALHAGGAARREAEKRAKTQASHGAAPVRLAGLQLQRNVLNYGSCEKQY